MGNVRVAWNGAGATRTMRVGAAAGLNHAAEKLMAAARAVTPELTDTLENSSKVYQANSDHLASQVQYNTPYAVIQHEKTYYHHSNGRAKYLEGPLAENARELAAIVVQSIRQGL